MGWVQSSKAKEPVDRHWTVTVMGLISLCRFLQLFSGEKKFCIVISTAN